MCRVRVAVPRDHRDVTVEHDLRVAAIHTVIADNLVFSPLRAGPGARHDVPRSQVPLEPHQPQLSCLTHPEVRIVAVHSGNSNPPRALPFCPIPMVGHDHVIACLSNVGSSGHPYIRGIDGEDRLVVVASSTGVDRLRIGPSAGPSMSDIEPSSSMGPLVPHDPCNAIITHRDLRKPVGHSVLPMQQLLLRPPIRR